MLNNVPTMMEIDTGSDVTVISSRQFEQIQQGSRIHSGEMIQPPRKFYAVWVSNFAGIPKWLPGVFQTKLGPVSFTVGVTDGRVWKRHMDHISLRIHEEGDGDAGRALPMLTGVRAFMDEKKVRDARALSSG